MNKVWVLTKNEETMSIYGGNNGDTKALVAKNQMIMEGTDRDTLHIEEWEVQ